jgi:hypothetical protein
MLARLLAYIYMGEDHKREGKGVRILWVPFNFLVNRINPSSPLSHWYLNSIGGSETSDPLYALRFWKVRESLGPTSTAVDDWTEIGTEICSPADLGEGAGTGAHPRTHYCCQWGC